MSGPAAARERVLVPAPLVRGARGAVASPHYLASAAGLGILRAGGSAVDAAIGTNAALAVVASHMCGLGGDAFWLIWDPPSEENGMLHALNGSGRSAQGATIEAAERAGLREVPLRGPWSVTVPGAVRSWGDAHARFGRLPWAELLAPAIELADGFAATETWSAVIERAVEAYGAHGDWARTFRPEGRAWRVGEQVRLPRLAETLRILAADGPAAAYEGAIGLRAAAYLKDAGSPLRASDFARHRSDWVEPISAPYRGVVSYSHPPNSSGATALELLAVLARFDPPPPSAFGARGVEDARWVHLGLEASRLTLADRETTVTDPDDMAPGALDRLLEPAHAAALAERIDPERASPPPATPLAGAGDTIFLCTADRWGGVVSLIESNYAGFGSGLVDPDTGIAFQNRGAFFKLDPRHRNALAPAKRTMHTLTPGMLFREGRPWIAHGQMGGEIQPQLFAQFISSVVDGGLDIASALAVPRWAADVEHHQGPPALSVLEPRFVAAVEQGLRARGHDVRLTDPFSSGMGHAHAIEVVSDAATTSYAAAADPRSEGLPLAW